MIVCETWLESELFYLPFQRKQKEVQKENEFYFQLLQQALPADQIQNLDTKGKFSDGNMKLKESWESSYHLPSFAFHMIFSSWSVIELCMDV